MHSAVGVVAVLLIFSTCLQIFNFSALDFPTSVHEVIITIHSLCLNYWLYDWMYRSTWYIHPWKACNSNSTTWFAHVKWKGLY